MDRIFISSKSVHAWCFEAILITNSYLHTLKINHKHCFHGNDPTHCKQTHYCTVSPYWCDKVPALFSLLLFQAIHAQLTPLSTLDATHEKRYQALLSLVPRPSITANAVKGLVKLLRRMTSGRCMVGSDVLCASVRHMYCSVVVKCLSAIAPALV